MVQPRQVTVDDIVGLLRTGEQPVYTMGNIAEEFDVSKETVRRRMTEVVEREGVREDKIGKANVYWFEDGETDTTGPPVSRDSDQPGQPADPPERTTEPAEEPQESEQPGGNEEANEELSPWKQAPGLIPFVMVFGTLIFGWIAFQEAKESIDGLGTAAEVTWQALTGGLFVATVAIVAQWVLWWSGAGAGPVAGALSYGVGAAALAAIVLGNGGLLGAPANASEAIVSSIWGRSV